MFYKQPSQYHQSNERSLSTLVGGDVTNNTIEDPFGRMSKIEMLRNVLGCVWHGAACANGKER